MLCEASAHGVSIALTIAAGRGCPHRPARLRFGLSPATSDDPFNRKTPARPATTGLFRAGGQLAFPASAPISRACAGTACAGNSLVPQPGQKWPGFFVRWSMSSAQIGERSSHRSWPPSAPRSGVKFTNGDAPGVRLKKSPRLSRPCARWLTMVSVRGAAPPIIAARRFLANKAERYNADARASPTHDPSSFRRCSPARSRPSPG